MRLIGSEPTVMTVMVNREIMIVIVWQVAWQWVIIPVGNAMLLEVTVLILKIPTTFVGSVWHH